MRKWVLAAFAVVLIEFVVAPLGGRVFDYAFPRDRGLVGMMPELPDFPVYQWGYASILAIGIVIGVAIARLQARGITIPTLLRLRASKNTSPSFGREAGFARSSSDEFDIIPAGSLTVHGSRNEDGIDISARIQYRNRSMRPVNVKVIERRFEIDGKTPNGAPASGVSGTLKARTTETVSFNSIRIYKEGKRSGHAIFAIMFGEQQERPPNMLSIRYDFTLLSYPKGQGREELKTDYRASHKYYIQDTAS